MFSLQLFSILSHRLFAMLIQDFDFCVSKSLFKTDQKLESLPKIYWYCMSRPFRTLYFDENRPLLMICHIDFNNHFDRNIRFQCVSDTVLDTVLRSFSTRSFFHKVKFLTKQFIKSFPELHDLSKHVFPGLGLKSPVLDTVFDLFSCTHQNPRLTYLKTEFAE